MTGLSYTALYWNLLKNLLRKALWPLFYSWECWGSEKTNDTLIHSNLASGRASSLYHACTPWLFHLAGYSYPRQLNLAAFSFTSHMSLLKFNFQREVFYEGPVTHFIHFPAVGFLISITLYDGVTYLLSAPSQRQVCSFFLPCSLLLLAYVSIQ